MKKKRKRSRFVVVVVFQLKLRTSVEKVLSCWILRTSVIKKKEEKEVLSCSMLRTCVLKSCVIRWCGSGRCAKVLSG